MRDPSPRSARGCGQPAALQDRVARPDSRTRAEEGTGDSAQALRDLRESERRLRALLEFSPDTLIRIRVDGTLLALHARAGFEEQFAPRGRIGRSVFDRYTSEQADGLRRLFERVCRSGGTERMEHRSENEKGVRYFETRVVASGSDEVLLIVRDITETRLALDALRDSEERLRRIFQDGPLGMALIGPDLSFVDANAMLCRSLGYAEDELVGRSFLDLTHPDDVAHDKDLLRRLRDGEIATFTAEKRYIHRDGHAVPFRVTGALIRDADGTPRYGIGMFEDISEARRAAAALRTAEERLRQAERLASIGHLAAGIAHEINNPIGSILMAAQYALAAGGPGTLDDVTAKSLRDVTAHARRCARIVKSVLAFAGQAPLERRPENLNDCLERIRDLVQDVARREGAGVELAPSAAPLPVCISATAIEQVLLNLIRNAAQASDAGGVVRVETEAGPGVARILVRDEGCGMSAEAATYLFDPFYTTRREQGGIGLGLSLSHGIIAEHGGEIRVDSRPGGGTTVTVELPAGPG